jgi:hypothetical protein
MSEGAVQVACVTAENVNLAFYENGVPLVRELSIENRTGSDLDGVEIHLFSEPSFITPGVWRVERIADNDTHHLKTVDLKLDHGFLAGLTASRRGEMRIRVNAGSKVLADWQVDVNLLPPSHWGGSVAAPELLAAFVRPTNPSVDVILREAADKLMKAGRDPAIDGYAKGKKARAWEIAESIWAALVDHGIAYVLPPKSFERHGQPVRSPSEILARKVGTCLDLALLYASCLEQAGLNPLVVLTEGHAFAGLWLKNEQFSTPIVDDMQMLRKRIQLEEMMLVEMTALTGASPARFKQAVVLGAKHVAEDANAPLEVAIDVKRARAACVRPLDLDGGGTSPVGPKTAPVQPGELDTLPVFEEDMDRSAPAPERPLNRLEKWKASLLDLSLRNRLLNFKDGKNTILIECPDPARLEDLIAAGHRFKMQGRAKVLDGSDGRDPELIKERMNEDARRTYVRAAMDRDELHADAPEADLEARLTDLFRAGRLAFEEGGSNVLYLCLGFLKWTPQDGAGPYRAPLVLLPVQLERKSVRSGFRLALHDDEVRFNPTLLQLLRIDFGLMMPELEGDLPKDGSGVDVAGIWRIVRQHVKELKSWEVAEQVMLTTLSFTKYLMWKDLIDRTDDLKRNPVVRHLIDTPTHTYNGSGGDFVEPSKLDSVVDPSDLFAPQSADSSQLAAVVAAQRGKDFVLFGPPGTGKSQTITNMIANLLAHGRTVLFVSQKTAALEVVRRRLQQIGLGSYCLECHSTKAQKSSVVGQLGDAWRSRGTSTEEHWDAATSELRKKRDELNALVSSLHRRHANGMSAYEAFSRIIADRGVLPAIPLSWPARTVHSPEILASMRAVCGDLRTTLLAIGDPTRHPLRGIEQTKWSPAWVEDLNRLAGNLKSALVELKAHVENFASSIGYAQGSWEQADLHHLFVYGALLMRPEASDGALLLEANASQRVHVLRAAADLVERATAKRSELSTAYDLKVTRLDLAQIRVDWAAACTSNILFRSGRKAKIRQLLNPYCPGGVPDDIARDLVVLQDLAALTTEAEKLASGFSGMERLWKGLDTDAAHFETIIAWSVKARENGRARGARHGTENELVGYIATLFARYAHLFMPGGEARKAFDASRTAFESTRGAAIDLGICIGLSDPTKLLDFGLGWMDELARTLDRWTVNLIKAPQWARWRTAASTARASGLEPLVDAIEAGAVRGDQIAPVFEFAYATWCAAEIVNQDEVLSSFLAEQHEAAIEAFAAADARVAELSKEIVRARIGGSVPTLTNFGKDPEWGALAHEVNKKASYLPLRQLFGKIPNVLTQLAPCVMMSPLSIAQYLPPDSKPFDTVIFDEASQMPVWDAIGAIARGTQVIVVGDPEQLPPTSVGQHAADGDEDDHDVVQTQQSILDECLSSNLPSMRLTWHYRSKHESLIAFSNAKYYRGELVTFPSPVTKDAAVRLVPVEHGIYERGKARVNRKEAQELVADVVRRMRSSTESIGIVTFNAEQQRLIENLLDNERMNDPSLERHWEKSKTTEPVFVKNLENVQGDERDVIYFSVAVGKDANGRVSAQISSLNGEGGHRRLNVAVTRARSEMVVFSSLQPEQIDLGRTNARGVVDFKHFLEFAKHGPRAIAEAFAPTGRDTESPFEEAVKRALEAKGWSVIPQIGVSFFRVDLGVVHPDTPGRFLAGIEADGALFHSSASARDRDKLREAILTNLGWRIRRIWSTEWWMDSVSALEKIHQRLLADLEQDRAPAPISVDQAAHEEDPEIESDHSTDDVPVSEASNPIEEAYLKETVPVLRQLYAHNSASEQSLVNIPPSYVVANPSDIVRPDREKFYDPGYLIELCRMVDHVVATEAPVYFDVIVDRIARAHGFQRAKGGIRGVIKQALGNERYPISEDGEREIVWPKDWNIDVLPPWRTSETRRHDDIPLPELASLASRLRDNGLEGEGLVRAMQVHFNLARLAISTRERFEAAIALLS